MSTTFSSLCKSILGQRHTDGSHFCDGANGSLKCVSPIVHLVFPLREPIWLNWWEIIRSSVRALTNLPKETPLGVVLGNQRGLRFILARQIKSCYLFAMVSCLLNKFWCSSDLVVAFRLNVFAAVLAGVEHITGLFEVVLHHIYVVFIVLRVDSWVPDQQNAELVEALSDFLALDPYCIRQLVLINAINYLQVKF